jgi:hypothetical protein
MQSFDDSLLQLAISKMVQATSFINIHLRKLWINKKSLKYLDACYIYNAWTILGLKMLMVELFY